MLLTITLLSIVALILFGVGDYAVGRSGRNVNPHIVNFLMQFLSFLVVLPVGLATGISMGMGDALATIGIGIIFGFGFIYFIKAMAIGPMGVAAPLVNSSAVVALIVSLIFFGITLSATAIFALIIVAIGAVLLTFTKDTLKKGKFLHSKTARLAGITMLIHGVPFAFLTPIIERNSWVEVLFMMSLGTLLATIAIIIWVFAQKFGELKILFTRHVTAATVGGLFTGAGAIAMFSAGGINNNLVLPFVLTSASPLITSAIAYVIDHEKISLINRVGAVVVVAGMIVLNF